MQKWSCMPRNIQVDEVPMCSDENFLCYVNNVKLLIIIYNLYIVVK